MYVSLHVLPQTVTKAMSELEPPVSLGSPESEEHLQYLWSDEVARKDYDFPEVIEGKITREVLKYVVFLCLQKFFEAVAKVWSDSGVQACFARSNEYQLIDSAA